MGRGASLCRSHLGAFTGSSGGGNGPDPLGFPVALSPASPGTGGPPHAGCVLQAAAVATKLYRPQQAARRAEPGRVVWLSCFRKDQAPACFGGLRDTIQASSSAALIYTGTTHNTMAKHPHFTQARRELSQRTRERLCQRHGLAVDLVC